MSDPKVENNLDFKICGVKHPKYENVTCIIYEPKETEYAFPHRHIGILTIRDRTSPYGVWRSHIQWEDENEKTKNP